MIQTNFESYLIFTLFFFMRDVSEVLNTYLNTYISYLKSLTFTSVIICKYLQLAQWI